MRFTLFILICCIIATLCSCSKQTDYSYLNTDRRQQPVKHQQWIDHYSKDTTKLGVRTLWAQWYEQPGQDNSTLIEQKFLNCNTDSIEHWYYRTPDTKLQPTRIDTNWTNYNK